MNKKLIELKNNKEKILFIHYSCKSFDDENECLSPRVTSIAVYYYDERAIKSFSFNIAAEVLHISKEDIENHYDKIEKKILEDFFLFAKEHYDYYWIHWNMTSMNYGFDALEHRYEVLTRTRPYHISEDKRYNLSKLIAFEYGKDYADDPKMKNLIILNWGKLPRDYLEGQDEIEAFENKDYIKMHKSTIEKVKFFRYIFIKLLHKEVKTKKKNWKLIFKEIFENPFIQILSLLSILITVGSGIVILIKWIYSFLK